MPHEVFISYSTHDSALADRIVQTLEAAGIRCWISSRDIPPGASNWATEIEKAIREARAMVLVVSPDFNRSNQTPKEIILGIDQKLHILPVRTSNFKPWGHLRYFLADIQWLDASGGPPLQHLDILGDVLRNLLRGDEDTSSPISEKEVSKIDVLQPASVLGILPAGAFLKLELSPPMKLRNDQPSLWLQAYNALVPMTGRESEIDDLQKMLNNEDSFHWRVFFGEAGMGKTRLAIEFARLAMSQGWHAGFLSASNLQRFVTDPQVALWRPCVPTLIVVDYAASKLTDLRNLVEQLATLGVESSLQHPESPSRFPVRMLLLERHADESRGWLHELLAAGEGAVGDLVRNVSFLGIKKLQPPGGKSSSAQLTRQIITDTFMRWAAITGKEAPALPDFSEKDWRSIQLSSGNRPLYLQMAAIHACERRSAVELPSWGRGVLLSSAVKRERDYVLSECRGDGDLRKAVEHVTAVLCLAGTGAARGRQWLQFVAKELDAIGVTNISPNQVEQHRRAIFAEPQRGVDDAETGVIQPDIVSEGFAAQVLYGEDKTPPCEALNQVLSLADTTTTGGANKAWANLVRMVQDLSSIEKLLLGSSAPEPIDSWLPPLLEGRPVEELRQLVNVIPERSLALHEFALTVNQHLLKRVPQESRAERAEFLLSLGTHRCRMLRTTRPSLEQAIKELQEAVSLFTTLPLDGEGGCRLKLAKAHRMLDNAFNNLGQVKEAIRHSTIAILLCGSDSFEWCVSQSELPPSSMAERPIPEAVHAQSEFADNLNNLGLNLNALGEYKDALVVLLRAVEVGEQLISHDWKRHAPSLARYLNNLSNAQQACKDLDAAITSSRRSAEIRLEFARENPDEFSHPLSLTLQNLVALEYGRKDNVAAHSATERLIAVYDELSARDPGSYRSPLAQCYHNIGCVCRELGNKTEAIRHTLQAITIREELVESDFDSYALELAWSHNNIGHMYKESNEPTKARPHLERAYDLRLRWFQAESGRKLPELTKSANYVAQLCKQLGDSSGEALWLERAVEHGVAQDLPPYERAMASHSLAEALGRLGRLSEAAAAASLAAQGLREAFRSCSCDKDLREWADTGCNLGSALALQGDWSADAQVLAEGEELGRQLLAKIDPQNTELSFTRGAVMNNLGHAIFRRAELLGQPDGVRDGLKLLESSAEHFAKQSNQAAAAESLQLAQRAAGVLAALEASPRS